jgi:hypothetical protein
MALSKISRHVRSQPTFLSISHSQSLIQAESHALTNDGITVSHFSVQLSYTLKLLEIPAHDEQAFAKFIYPLIQTLSSLANIVAALVSVSQVSLM